MSNTIAISREQEIFFSPEQIAGTISPPVAADFVVAAGPGEINQQPEYTDSPEVVNSRDVLDRCQSQPGPGDWSFPALCRPAGVAGDIPGEANLLEGLFGLETIAAGVSVTYSTTIAKPSYTIWMRKGHTVFHGIGATVSSGQISMGNDCALKYEFGGQFMKMGWAGTDTITAEYDAGGVLDVTDARKYTVGAIVELETADGLTIDDNSGVGYTISAVDTDLNTITITAGGTPATFTTGDTVRGWLPTGTVVGTPLEARKGSVSIAGTTVPTQSFEINFTDNTEYLDQENTESGYTEAYVPSEREVTGNIMVYFRENDLVYFHNGLEGEEVEVILLVGDTAGDIVTIPMPKTYLNMPNMEDADPTIALSIDFRALGTNGEDSITQIFT